MRTFIVSALLTFSLIKPATANDWHIMQDWHAKSRQAQSAFLKSGKGLSDMPSRFTSAFRLAIFSAANAVEQNYSQYLPGLETPKGADAVLAATAAASHMLALSFGESAKDIIKAQEDKYYKGAKPATLKASIALGKVAAEAAFRRAQETVADTYPPYSPQTSAGVYITPHMPVFPPSFLDVKPWFLSSRDAIRAPRPPALDSDTWARDFNEVRRLGAKHGSDRTAEQTFEATFWAGQGNEMLVDQVAEQRGWTLLQAARLYAMLSMSIDDSTLAVVESKYFHNFWRPITAIRRADLDGNDATHIDAGWEPYKRTPNHPEYPCAHCQRGAAAAEILESNVKLKDGETLKVFAPEKPETYITISTFKEFEERMSNSRIYFGAHYRTSNEIGEKMGRQVAKLAQQKFAVPLN